MVKAAVIGASGYAGAEVLRYLSAHPEIEVAAAVAHSQAGLAVAEVHPWLRRAYPSLVLTDVDDSAVAEAQLVFLALPHGQSAAVVGNLSTDALVVDLGADFRLQSANAWTTYYSGSHAGTWTYGLADVPHFATAVATATRVANPGCYATALALSMAPAAASCLADLGDVVAVAASGTSGAGRSADISLSATEVIGSMRAYKAGGVHQHTPEVEQTLSVLSSASVALSFTPVLAPMPRGIHATVSAPLNATPALVQAAYQEFFADSPFVTVLTPGQEGRTADVYGTNEALLAVHCDAHSNRLVVTCVIDNLGKGAAGQAIQNANIMLGLSPATGLSAQKFAAVLA